MVTDAGGVIDNFMGSWINGIADDVKEADLQRSKDVLLSAARAGDADQLAAALQLHGITTETTDEHGTSPLVTACSGGHLECVRLLVKRGADI